MVKKMLMSSALFLLSACGGGGAAEVAISMSDKPEDEKLASFYTPEKITVAAGKKVKFTLSNAGTVPHNIRIAGPDGEYNTDDDVLVGPQILNAGETAVFEWTAPDQAGPVEFRCDFHLNTGTITVQ